MNNPLQLSLVNFRKGAYIIVEGKQKADYFYIIRQGQVQISKEVEIVEEEGGICFLPEISLVLFQQCPLTVILKLPGQSRMWFLFQCTGISMDCLLKKYSCGYENYSAVQ